MPQVNVQAHTGVYIDKYYKAWYSLGIGFCPPSAASALPSVVSRPHLHFSPSRCTPQPPFPWLKNPSTRRPRNKKAAPGCPGSSPNRRTMELRAVPLPAAALTRHRCSGRGLFPFFLPTRVRVASKSSARASRVSSKRQEAITASLPYRQDHGVARPSPVCCATILWPPSPPRL